MRWIFATLFFGLFTAVFCILFWIGWNNHAAGVTFTSSHTGRGGFTTLDGSLFLLIGAVTCALGSVSSIAAMLVSRGGKEQSKVTGDPANFGADGWLCSHCHESNPCNFDECWKYQHTRPHTQPAN